MGFEDGVLASQPRPALKRRKPLRRLERVQTAAKKAELFAAHADYAGPPFLGCSDRQAGRGQQRRAGGQRPRAREEEARAAHAGERPAPRRRRAARTGTAQLEQRPAWRSRALRRAVRAAANPIAAASLGTAILIMPQRERPRAPGVARAYPHAASVPAGADQEAGRAGANPGFALAEAFSLKAV